MADQLQSFPITKFKGGISDFSNEGVEGSFKFGYGINLRGETASLSCNQKLKKDSGSTVTELIQFGVSASDGNFYGFGDSGGIYKRTSGGTWSKVATDVDGAILGAAEYTHKDGGGTPYPYIVWATQTKLKEVKLVDGFASPITITTLARGTAGVWHTMNSGSSLGVLLYCDDDYIGMLDYEGAFNTNALDLPGGIRSTTIIDSGDLVIIGAIEKERQRRGYLFTWNKLADSWLQKKDIQAQGVNSLNVIESGLLVQGQNGLQYWDTVNYLPLKDIPGYGSTTPGSQTIYRALPHFGVSGGFKNGIYAYGRRNKNAPLALNLEYLISPVASAANPDTALASANYEIGMIHNHQGTLLVSWKDSSGASPVYGVDVIDTENKAVAVYESLEYDAGSSAVTKLFNHVKVVTKPLPASTKVEVWYRVNNNDNWIPGKLQDGTTEMTGSGLTKGVFTLNGEGEIYEVRLRLTPSGNDTPEVLALHTYYSPLGIY